MRIPQPCDFCGRTTTRADRVNYDEVCETCRHPHRARTVLVAVKAPVERPMRRVA